MSKFDAAIVSAGPNGKVITAIIDGTPYTAEESHPSFLRLSQAVKDKDADAFVKCVDIKQALAASGVVEVIGGVVSYRGEPLHNALTRRILDLMREGYDYTPMVNFLSNLMQNPSARAIEELYTFLENRHLPITEDGCFLAYKAVSPNYLDKYSGTIDNSPGQTVTFDRSKVDDNAMRTCSYGLHCGALEYSGPNGWYYNSGDKIVIVKINPKDAVSVPLDHNAQKLRVCEYVVLCDYQGAMEKACYDEDGEELESIVEVDDPGVSVADLSEGDDIVFKMKAKGKKIFARVRSFTATNVVFQRIKPDEEAGKCGSIRMDRMKDIEWLNI